MRSRDGDGVQHCSQPYIETGVGGTTIYPLTNAYCDIGTLCTRLSNNKVILHT